MPSGLHLRRHGERIVLPYAVSDTYSNFATINIVALLQALSQPGRQDMHRRYFPQLASNGQRAYVHTRDA